MKCIVCDTCVYRHFYQVETEEVMQVKKGYLDRNLQHRNLWCDNWYNVS
jgi:hypothetical protein